MEIILSFIMSCLNAPLTTVMSLGALGIFIYWFTTIRPKEKKEQQEIYDKYINTIIDYKEQITKTTSNYDKTLDLCNKVIENNTRVIETVTKSLEVHNKVLEEYLDNDYIFKNKIENFQRELVANQHEIRLQIAEKK